jgi:hypothetical protein
MRTGKALRPIIATALAALAACSDGTLPSEPSSPQYSRSPQGEARLAAIFDRASAEVLALPGTVYADHDESVGRLVFGVENTAAINGVRMALERLGLSGNEVEIRLASPIRQLVTLRDRFRPTIAGTQIHFGNYLCTMGFNVTTGSGDRSFITNSHCTNTQGGVEGTQYYQPTSSVDPTVIATEVADPGYFRGGACPRGRKCRYSDASRANYSSSVASNQGEIAKPASTGGTLEVSGIFTITAQDASTKTFARNTVVNKVGRTTGWSQGPVTNSCVNTSVSGSNITQLCQTFVSAAVGSGDSGSPVFRITSGDQVTLVGILWGGSSDNRTFVFSPLSQVVQEFGTVNATK